MRVRSKCAERLILRESERKMRVCKKDCIKANTSFSNALFVLFEYYRRVYSHTRDFPIFPS